MNILKTHSQLVLKHSMPTNYLMHLHIILVVLYAKVSKDIIWVNKVPCFVTP